MKNYKNLTDKQMANTTDVSKKILEIHNEGNKVKKFIKEKLPIILKNLGIYNHPYAVGGTAALMYYGINLNRGIGDIDIVIPRNGARKLLCEISDKARKSPFYEVIQDNSEYRFTHNMHIKLKCANGPSIDIVECDKDLDFVMVCSTEEIVPIEHIIYLKNKWGRDKDIQDLKKIYEYLGSLTK